MHSVLPFLCFACFLLPYVVSLPQNIYVDKRCNLDNSTRNITTTFQINRNQTFLSLSTQAAIKAGFSKNTTGVSPDQVSALFLCRGDYDDVNVCGSCLAEASKSMQECMDLQGIIWYDQCFLHYSNQQILDLYRNSDMHFHSNIQAASGWDSSNVTATSYITSLLTDLLNNISYLAAYKSNPGKLFFTGRINVTDISGQIFGLSQCTPDMPGDACHECQTNLTIHMLNVFNGSAGVQLLGDRCQLRYETYNFFQGNPLWTSGTIKKGHESKIVIIASSIAVAFLLAGCSLFFVCIRKRKSREIKDIGPGHQELTTTEDSSPELSHFSFSEIENATNNFNLKLGEGGFGSVYKGTLPGGLEIAVKRLAVHSGQGLLEFRN